MCMPREDKLLNTYVVDSAAFCSDWRQSRDCAKLHVKVPRLAAARATHTDLYRPSFPHATRPL